MIRNWGIKGILIFMGGAAVMIGGIAAGGGSEVMLKAARVCLECIGIG